MTHIIATHIELRPNHAGHLRAYIDDTRVRVQDVAVMAEIHGRTADEIVTALPHLSLAQVHAALSYYFDHRAEIQQELREDQELVRHLRSVSNPGSLERRGKAKMEPTSDAVPS